MTIHYIYHLVDPNTKKVHYVGKTTKPKSRLAAHVKESKQKQNTAKKQWINKLLATNQVPVMIIVAQSPDESHARKIESKECHNHLGTIYNIHDPNKGAKDFKQQQPISSNV